MLIAFAVFRLQGTEHHPQTRVSSGELQARWQGAGDAIVPLLHSGQAVPTFQVSFSPPSVPWWDLGWGSGDIADKLVKNAMK